MSRGKAITLGIFTAWPFVFLVIFTVAMFATFLSDISSSAAEPEPPLLFFLVIPLQLLTMLVVFILVIIYVVFLFRTETVSQDKKALWAAVLILGNMIAMPVFWYLYVWKQPKEPSPEQLAEGDAKGSAP